MKLNDSRLNEWRREEMETAIKSMLWEMWSFSFLTVRELNGAKFWKLPEEKERSNTAEREKISEVESICIINFSISPLLSTRCILISQMLKKKKNSPLTSTVSLQLPFCLLTYTTKILKGGSHNHHFHFFTLYWLFNSNSAAILLWNNFIVTPRISTSSKSMKNHSLFSS